MKRLFLAMWLMCAVLGSFLAAQEGAPSTAEERARAVKIARQLEQDPLNAGLRKDREWLVLWLIRVPDIQVKLCPAVLGNFVKQNKYKYSTEIMAQLLASSAAFIVENPKLADDTKAMYGAALDGALKAYTSILKTEPKAKSAALDELLAKSAEERQAHLREADKQCQ